MRVFATVEAEVRSSSVSVVHLHIVFSKAALQKRGSMEPMEPPLDPPLEGKEGVTSLFCETGRISKCTKNRTVEAFQSLLCWCMIPSAVAFSEYFTLIRTL